jgi:hypothetical protein
MRERIGGRGRGTMVRHKKEIIAALKIGGGDERRRVFKFWEEEYGAKLGKGEKGYKLYCELLELVRKADDEKAVEDYRNRFLPLCDRDIVAGKGFGVLPPSRDMQKLKEPRKKGLFGRLFGG